MNEKLILSLVSYHLGRNESNVSKWGLARFIFESPLRTIISLDDLPEEDFATYLNNFKHLSYEEQLRLTEVCTNSTYHYVQRIPGRALNYNAKPGKFVSRFEMLTAMVKGVELTNSEVVSLRQYIYHTYSPDAVYRQTDVQIVFNNWEALGHEQKLAFAKECEDYGKVIIHVTAKDHTPHAQ